MLGGVVEFKAGEFVVASWPPSTGSGELCARVDATKSAIGVAIRVGRSKFGSNILLFKVA